MDSQNPEQPPQQPPQFSFSANDLVSVGAAEVEETGSAHKYKVLVVEDDLALARDMLTALARAGMECRHAPDGPLALEALKASNFHLLVIDLALPQMSGAELCRRVRKHHTLPMIVATEPKEETQLKCFGLGADDYIIKPFSDQMLVIRVISLLRRSYVYNKKKHPNPVPFSSLPISATVSDPHIKPALKAPGIAGDVLLALPDSPPESTADTSNSTPALPSGWSRCDICDYMGPTPKFTTQDGNGRPVMACPHCGDTSNIEYALG